MNYDLQYKAAILNAVVLTIAGALSAYGALPAHPSWLTSDVMLTAGIVFAICGGLAATVLPPLQRTPKVREDKYIVAATMGALPEDIAKKHPTIRPG